MCSSTSEKEFGRSSIWFFSDRKLQTYSLNSICFYTTPTSFSFSGYVSFSVGYVQHICIDECQYKILYVGRIGNLCVYLEFRGWRWRNLGMQCKFVLVLLLAPCSGKTERCIVFIAVCQLFCLIFVFFQLCNFTMMPFL